MVTVVCYVASVFVPYVAQTKHAKHVSFGVRFEHFSRLRRFCAKQPPNEKSHSSKETKRKVCPQDMDLYSIPFCFRVPSGGNNPPDPDLDSWIWLPAPLSTRNQRQVSQIELVFGRQGKQMTIISTNSSAQKVILTPDCWLASGRWFSDQIHWLCPSFRPVKVQCWIIWRRG